MDRSTSRTRKIANGSEEIVIEEVSVVMSAYNEEEGAGKVIKETLYKNGKKVK